MRFYSTDARRPALPNGFSGSPARRALLLIWNATLLAACGGEPAQQTDTTATAATPAATSSAPASACALLPATDVTAVIGETVRDSVAMQMTGEPGAPSLSQCHYASASNPVAASLMLRRSATGETVAQGSQSVRETMKQSGITLEDVPGLGEVAFWGGNQLHVFTNNGWYLIVSPPASGGLAQARALAERALPRL